MSIMRPVNRIILSAILTVSACSLPVAVSARGLPASEGIPNFGKVSDKLYRGAQPDAVGITNLARLGIKSIIDLRMPNEVWKPEASVAQAQGILYTNVPMHGIRRPGDAQVQNVLELMETLPGPVFIHCQHGCDRTGTIVACYRIKNERWAKETALKEAVKYGISRFEFGMKRFVLAFAIPGQSLASK
jgi:protein tyrosine/serine phosphatase